MPASLRQTTRGGDSTLRAPDLQQRKHLDLRTRWGERGSTRLQRLINSVMACYKRMHLNLERKLRDRVCMLSRLYVNVEIKTGGHARELSCLGETGLSKRACCTGRVRSRTRGSGEVSDSAWAACKSQRRFAALGALGSSLRRDLTGPKEEASNHFNDPHSSGPPLHSSLPGSPLSSRCRGPRAGEASSEGRLAKAIAPRPQPRLPARTFRSCAGRALPWAPEARGRGRRARPDAPRPLSAKSQRIADRELLRFAQSQHGMLRKCADARRGKPGPCCVRQPMTPTVL